MPNAGDAVRYRDAPQATAGHEGIKPDTGELTVRSESDTRQAGTVSEDFIPDTGDTLTDRDAR